MVSQNKTKKFYVLAKHVTLLMKLIFYFLLALFNRQYYVHFRSFFIISRFNLKLHIKFSCHWQRRIFVCHSVSKCVITNGNECENWSVLTHALIFFQYNAMLLGITTYGSSLVLVSTLFCSHRILYPDEYWDFQCMMYKTVLHFICVCVC